MADEHLLQFLLRIIAEPDGLEKWRARRARGHIMDLSSADFTGKKLQDFDFSQAILSTAIFLGADLTGVDFTDETSLDGGEAGR